MPAPSHLVLERLREDVEAVCPIVDIKIGLRADRDTWTFTPAPSATAPQIAAGEAVVAAFQDTDAAHEAWLEALEGAILGSPRIKRLGAAFNTSSNALADVTGLSFPLKAGLHYAFRFVGAYTSAAGTTGLALAINGPAASVFGAIAQIHESATAVRGGATPNYNTALTGQNSGGGTRLPWWIEGTVTTTAAGVLVLRAASEVNGSQVTLTAASFGRVERAVA